MCVIASYWYSVSFRFPHEIHTKRADINIFVDFQVKNGGKKWEKVAVCVTFVIFLFPKYDFLSNMAAFTGQYEVKVDAKGRLRLPTDLLRQVEESTRTKYVLNKGLDKCLRLYPIAQWAAITE